MLGLINYYLLDETDKSPIVNVKLPLASVDHVGAAKPAAVVPDAPLDLFDFHFNFPSVEPIVSHTSAVHVPEEPEVNVAD